jgi:hypothetical protein
MDVALTANKSTKRKCNGRDTVRFIFLCVFAVMRLAFISVLTYFSAYDLTRYTYISYTAVTIIYILLVCTQFSVHLHRILILYAAPYVLQNAILVAFCVVMIVVNNPTMMTLHIDKYGGDSTIGLVYAVDFIIHHLPPIEALIVLIIVFSYYSAILRHYVDYCLKYKAQKAFYVLYFMLVDAVCMFIYTLIFDFQSFYPNSYGIAVIYAMVISACLVVAGSTFAVLYYMAPQHITVAIERHTASKRQIQPNTRRLTHAAKSSARVNGQFYVSSHTGESNVVNHIDMSPIERNMRSHHVVLRTLLGAEVYTLE